MRDHQRMTKPVTSLALMQLIEQGRLGLDDPAEKYLPELAGLKVFESFDAKTGDYKLRPASRQPTVNHIGALGVPALKTALPRSADFTFIADGRDK